MHTQIQDSKSIPGQTREGRGMADSKTHDNEPTEVSKGHYNFPGWLHWTIALTLMASGLLLAAAMIWALQAFLRWIF